MTRPGVEIEFPWRRSTSDRATEALSPAGRGLGEGARRLEARSWTLIARKIAGEPDRRPRAPLGTTSAPAASKASNRPPAPDRPLCRRLRLPHRAAWRSSSTAASMIPMRDAARTDDHRNLWLPRPALLEQRCLGKHRRRASKRSAKISSSPATGPISEPLLPSPGRGESRVRGFGLSGNFRAQSPLTPTLSPPGRGSWGGADDQDRGDVGAAGH